MDRETTILIIEDDTDLRELISMAAEKEGYAVIEKSNGLEALEWVEGEGTADLVILDINMPGMDGFTFCRWLRERHPLIPVIFLSARSQEYDKVLALEIGGDDYLTKPFSMKELFTRIAVSLRRKALYQSKGNALGAQGFLHRGNVELDEERWLCRFQKKEVTLTLSEFRILSLLLSQKDRVCTREDLARAAYPEDHYNTGRSVDMHIHRIRQKFQKIQADFGSIESIYQVGYRWKD